MEKTKVSSIVKRVLQGKKLEDKVFSIGRVDFDKSKPLNIITPSRGDKIKFSNIQKKFPKSFKNIENKAFALHSFANHELLAIEIMAYTLNLLSDNDDPNLLSFKKSVVSSLIDEQKHLKLYISRLNELGYEFGDFPLNDFFWKYAHHIDSPEKYLSMMSLTFEAANLDFSAHFRDVFTAHEDFKTAKIMDIVFKDEISHVKIGGHFMNQWRKDKSLWEYYMENLIYPLTPSRSKGIRYQESFRRMSGLGKEFILSLNQYKDEFNITNRKS